MGKAEQKTVNVLSDLYADLFTLILYLRETSDFGDPRVLHDKIDTLFKNAEAKAKEMDIPEGDIQNAKYAISALVDETVLYSSWPRRNIWLNNPLVVEYFNDALAGETFFEKLEQIRGDKSKRDLLEVFYMCLLFGFEGKFKIQGVEELRQYIEGIRKELDFKGIDRLSPHPEAPKQSVKSRAMIPKWAMALSFAAVAVIAIVIFVVLKVKMGSFANGIVSGIARLYGR